METLITAFKLKAYWLDCKFSFSRIKIKTLVDAVCKFSFLQPNATTEDKPLKARKFFLKLGRKTDIKPR